MVPQNVRDANKGFILTKRKKLLVKHGTASASLVVSKVPDFC